METGVLFISEGTHFRNMRSTVFHIGDMIKFLWSKTEVCVDASDKVGSVKRLGFFVFFLPLLTINQTSVWIHATVILLKAAVTETIMIDSQKQTE